MTTIKRVTVSDVALACGLSRNTVSKVFNNRDGVPEATRQLVLNKARELGYRLAPDAAESVVQQKNQSIALLTRHMPANVHFGIAFIAAFADRLSRAGYTLNMCEITQEELDAHVLPEHISVEQTAGILAIELFDRAYHDMLCGLGIPVLYMDDCYDAATTPPRCDTVLMENIAATFAMTRQLIEQGAQHIGFVGDITHCSSFQERWLGFCSAVAHADKSVDKALCILEEDSPVYGNTDWLVTRLKQMPTLPDALVCANDYMALNVLTALKQLGRSVPDDVMLTGFDGTPQAAVVEPPLTTAVIPSADMGRQAAETLLTRIENPDRPYQRVYVVTQVELRPSSMRG